MIHPSLKTFSKAAMVAFVVCASAGFAMAKTNDQGQQNDQTASTSQQQQKEKKHAKKMAARLHDALFKNIDLSDKQESGVQKVMAHAREERMAWVKKHQDDFQDIRKEMRAARRDKDRGKARDARQKLVKLMKSAPKASDTMDKVRALLSKDQTKQFNMNIEELRKRMQQQRSGKARQRKNSKNDVSDQNQSQ